MTTESIHFVESHLRELADAGSLADRFHQDLYQRIRHTIQELNGPGFDLDLEWRDWGYWIDGFNRKKWQFALSTYYQQPDQGAAFKVWIWSSRQTATVRSEATRLLGLYGPRVDGTGDDEGWDEWSIALDTSEAAILEIQRLVQLFVLPEKKKRASRRGY